MARKFLYLVATLVVLAIATIFALRAWPEKLSQWAFVPGGEWQTPPPLTADGKGNAYSAPALWISRPGMAAAQDPARSQPKGSTPAADARVKAAVFFIHPTSYLARDHWNAPIDDTTSRDLAGTMVRGMASAFNATPDLWAPRYRQAAFGAFLTDAPAANQALNIAYGDVVAAFDQFLANIPAGQPIVLVGHSQGGLHLRRLMQERVGGKPLARRIAAAYVLGWPVSLDHDLPAMGLPACTRPDQAGCVQSWLSYAEPGDPTITIDAYSRLPGLDGQPLKGSPFLCSNPLTGSIGGTAPASANLGTLVPDAKTHEGTLQRNMAGARCGADGILYIGPGPELGAFVLPGNNYHVYDIPLFWANVRADFARRVAAWKP